MQYAAVRFECWISRKGPYYAPGLPSGDVVQEAELITESMAHECLSPIVHS